MARVEFYVLSASGEAERQRFACRLAEKAYRLDNSVHIVTRDRASAEQIDELLWTFRDGSFVPHEIASAGNEAEQTPVTIGFDRPLDEARDLLINLRDDIPKEVGTFPRIAEIVTSDESSRRLSRERFANYRDQGHTLDTHKL